MTAIDDLDADGGGVDLAAAAPDALARMPGALVLAHKLEDAAILLDHIMRAHRELWIA
jgi:hypothetical protein